MDMTTSKYTSICGSHPKVHPSMGLRMALSFLKSNYSLPVDISYTPQIFNFLNDIFRRIHPAPGVLPKTLSDLRGY